MVKPEDGSVYLATEQEIKDKDLPIHISIINRGDPELAAELKANNIEYVTMSGKGITTDGEEVVLSTEDQAAAEAAQQEPQRQGATTMTTDVIRGMGDLRFAGGTMTARSGCKGDGASADIRSPGRPDALSSARTAHLNQSPPQTNRQAATRSSCTEIRPTENDRVSWTYQCRHGKAR